LDKIVASRPSPVAQVGLLMFQLGHANAQLIIQANSAILLYPAQMIATSGVSVSRTINVNVMLVTMETIANMRNV